MIFHLAQSSSIPFAMRYAPSIFASSSGMKNCFLIFNLSVFNLYRTFAFRGRTTSVETIGKRAGFHEPFHKGFCNENPGGRLQVESYFRAIKILILYILSISRHMLPVSILFHFLCKMIHYNPSSYADFLG